MTKYAEHLKALVQFLVMNFIFIITSATISAASDVKLTPSRKHCDFIMDGRVESGDLRKIKAVIEVNDLEVGWDTETKICLNSMGGNLSEALDIADYIYESGIGTVVDQKESCVSACSLIFMMGMHYIGEVSYISRKMHPTAIIGFHRPELVLGDGLYAKTQVESAFDTAINSVLHTVEMANRTQLSGTTRMIEPELLREMLQHTGQDYFYLDTIETVLKFNVEVFGFQYEPQQLNDEEAFNACVNATLSSKDILAANQTGYEYFPESVHRRMIGTTEVIIVSRPGEDAPGYGCSIALESKKHSSGQKLMVYFNFECADPEFRDNDSNWHACRETLTFSLPEWSFITYSPTLRLSEAFSISVDDIVIHENLAFSGSDIDAIQSIEIQKCLALCMDNPRCKAFTYDRWNKWCFLKGRVSSLSVSAKATSGVTSQHEAVSHSKSEVSFKQYIGKFFPGDGFRTIASSSTKDCAQVCMSDSRCIAYTFLIKPHSHQRGKECVMFEKAGEYYSKENANSGAKFQH